MANLRRMSVRPLPDYVDSSSGASALLDAITRGKLHLTRFILDANDDSSIVNTRDFNGKTPLMRACYIKEEKTRGRIIHVLLQKRADVNLRDDHGRTALSYACEMRCNDVVQILVKNNVFPDIADNDGNTPLIHSALVGNDKAIEILMKSFRRLGLAIDRPNKRGETALIISAKMGFIACATNLAEGRADLTKTDPDSGLTAEQLARAQGCTTPEIAPLILQKRRRRIKRDQYYSYVNKSRTSINGTTRKKVRQVEPKRKDSSETSFESTQDMKRYTYRKTHQLRQPVTKLGSKEPQPPAGKLPNVHLHGCHYERQNPGYEVNISRQRSPAHTTFTTQQRRSIGSINGNYPSNNVQSQKLQIGLDLRAETTIDRTVAPIHRTDTRPVHVHQGARSAPRNTEPDALSDRVLMLSLDDGNGNAMANDASAY